MLFARIVLGLTAIMFGGHGAMCLLNPETIATESGIGLPSPGAATEVRAMYGGLEFALGAYFAASASRAQWAHNGIIVLVVAFSGLALARGAGLLMQAGADAYNVRAVVYEGMSAVLGLVALVLLRRSRPAA
jgi:hypothetical protein